MVKVTELAKPSLLLMEIIGAGRAVGEITAWLAGSAEARAAFRVRVVNMALTPRPFWHKKQFRKLEGDLCELKWKAENSEWRALGFDYEGYFVMVLGCIHKGGVYDPPNWKKTAQGRIMEVKNGRWKRIPFNHVRSEESGQ
jgi:hypothetical protein